MSGSAKKISQTFNGRNEWIVGGAKYFKLLETVNPVDVELYDKGGVRLIAAQVDGGFYQRVDFDRVVITTGASEAVSWMFAPDEGGSDRFTGVVDVSDQASRLLGIVYGSLGQLAQKLASGLNALVVSLAPADWLTDDNRAFSGYQAVGAGGAGTFAHSQIKNPAASGKTVYLDEIHIANQTGAADNYRYGHKDADLTTDGGAVCYSLKNSGAAASAHVRRQTNAASLLDVDMGHVFSPANVTAIIKFDPAVRLDAGEGFAIVQLSGNLAHFATFRIREY